MLNVFRNILAWDSRKTNRHSIPCWYKILINAALSLCWNGFLPESKLKCLWTCAGLFKVEVVQVFDGYFLMYQLSHMDLELLASVNTMLTSYRCTKYINIYKTYIFLQCFATMMHFYHLLSSTPDIQVWQALCIHSPKSFDGISGVITEARSD